MKRILIIALCVALTACASIKKTEETQARCPNPANGGLASGTTGMATSGNVVALAAALLIMEAFKPTEEEKAAYQACKARG